MTRRLLYFFVVIICMLLQLHALGQQYKWLNGGGSRAGEPNDEYVKYMCTDERNNVYIIAEVGSQKIATDTFYRDSSYNPYVSGINTILLASYNCFGSLRWAKIIDASISTYSSGMVYNNGSIYCIGDLEGDKRHIGEDTVGGNYKRAYLLRIDTQGVFKWIQYIGPDSINTYFNTSTKQSSSISIDGTGKIHYYNSIGDGVQINSAVRSKFGNYDIQYDSLGNIINVKKIEVDTNSYIQKVVVNKKTNFAYALLLRVEHPLSGPYKRYYSIDALDTNDKLVWADSSIYVYPGDTTSSLWDICCDSNSVYFTANSTVAFTMGSDSFLSSYAGACVHPNISVIGKLNCSGKLQWVFDLNNCASTTSLDGISVYGNKIAVTGTFDPLSVINHGTDTLHPVYNQGDNAIICIIDTNGHLLRLDQFYDQAHNDYGWCTSFDNSENVYIGGLVGDTISTGMLSYIKGGGNSDYFIAKYGYSCNCAKTDEPYSKFTVSGSGTLHFTYTGTGAIDSIRWHFGDGASSTSLNPTHTYSGNQVYYVCATIYTNCDSSSSCDTVQPYLGLPSISSNWGCMVHPNPTRGILVLENLTPYSYYILTDISSRILMQGFLYSQKQQLDISMLQPGFYLLQLVGAEHKKQTFKIIKE